MELDEIKNMNIPFLARIEMSFNFDYDADSIFDPPKTPDKKLVYFSRTEKNDERGDMLHYYTSVNNGNPTSTEEPFYIRLIENIQIWPE